MNRKIIKYFPNYEVTSCGKVFRKSYVTEYISKGKRISKINKAKPVAITGNGRGYLKVSLTGENCRKHIYVHQLVAEAFVENPHGYTEVDHDDDDRTNNDHSNLKWISRKENMKKMLDRNPHVLHNLKRN